MPRFVFSGFPGFLTALPAGPQIAYSSPVTGMAPVQNGVHFQMLTALIFGTDRETTSQLQQLCSLTQDVCVFRALERYPQAHESMRLLNSFAPQLVFLGADDEAAAHAVEHDIRSIQPTTAILGISSRFKTAHSFETT